MKNKFNSNLVYILIPLSILFMAVSFLFKSQQVNIIELSVAFILIYLVVSLIHHYFDKTLTLEITLEYILIASLSLVILTSYFAVQ